LENNLGKEGASVNVTLYQIKNVPVSIDSSMIFAADGYTIGNISIEPQQVSVSGDKADLSAINEISIPAEAVVLTELTKRTEQTVDILPYLPEGINLADANANNVVVTIMVEQPGTETYEVSTNSITVNNLADGLELNYGTTVDLEIQVRGPEEILDLFSIAKKVSIDLKDYTEEGTYTVPVEVELPSGCSLVNDVSVEVILEKKAEDISETTSDSDQD
jgi:YbbR domain-containing protein